MSNSSITIDNVIHGIKDQGIIRIDISGERRKALFHCLACGKTSEYDCTDGVDRVSCSHCNSGNLELKSPVVSVIAGVRGVPTPKTNMSKSEIKMNRFIKNCYVKSVELQHGFNSVLSLLESLEYPEEERKSLISEFDKIKKDVNILQAKKIDVYKKSLGI